MFFNRDNITPEMQAAAQAILAAAHAAQFGVTSIDALISAVDGEMHCHCNADDCKACSSAARAGQKLVDAIHAKLYPAIAEAAKDAAFNPRHAFDQLAAQLDAASADNAQLRGLVTKLLVHVTQAPPPAAPAAPPASLPPVPAAPAAPPTGTPQSASSNTLVDPKHPALKG